MSKDNHKSNKNLKHLTERARKVTQEGDTEPRFSGKLLEEKRDGMYHCIVCNSPLFPSDAKFDSGTGWPSFSAAVDNEHHVLEQDNSLGMSRTEVRCANCDAHLGHVFDDGPTDESRNVPATGKRFCINSCALDFSPDQDSAD
jgi:peptide-methionine (R)-S-oxide reductase